MADIKIFIQNIQPTREIPIQYYYLTMPIQLFVVLYFFCNKVDVMDISIREAEKARLQAYAASSKYGYELKTKYGLYNMSRNGIEGAHSAVYESRYYGKQCCRSGRCLNTLNRNELKQIVIGDKLAYIKVSSEWKKVNFGSIEPERRFNTCSSSNNSLDEFVMKFNSKMLNSQHFASLSKEHMSHLQNIENRRVRELTYVNTDQNIFREEDLNIDELIESFLDPDFLKKRLQSLLRKEFEDLHEVPVSIRDLMWYADNQNAALSDMNNLEENFQQHTYHKSGEDDIFYLFDKRTENIAESIHMASRHLFVTNEHLISCKAGQVPSSLSFRILIVIFKLIWSKFIMKKVIDLIIIQKLYFYIKSFYHRLDFGSRSRIVSILKSKNYLGRFLECFGYDFVLYDSSSQDISAINYLRCICYLHGSRSVNSITKEITEDIAIGKYFDNYIAKVNSYQHRRMPYTRSFTVS